jgi:hypothetical protein
MPMMQEEIGRTVQHRLQEILHDWRRVAAQELHRRVPHELGFGALHDLIPALAEAALVRPDSHQARRDLVRAAARHGETRKQESHTEHLLMLEHASLQRTLARFVERTAADPDARAEAIARIDVAIVLCMRAAMHGYERPEREAEGAWPQVVERLAEEWIPPPPQR